MRNTERIDRVLDKVSKLWHIYPDMRFGQLLENYVFEDKENMFFDEDDVSESKLDYALRVNNHYSK